MPILGTIASSFSAYTGETVTGGAAGYINNAFPFANNADTSLTLSNTPCEWACSNQGSYYGGQQTYSLGGTASFRISLNGGLNLPAGTYSYSGTHYLFWDVGGDSHDGMPLWAVTSTEKNLIVNTVRPPDNRNAQITKTGTFTVASSTPVSLYWEIYDGSSATSMGGRVYDFTVTKTA